MATHWKAYITMLKKYATELKDYIINDEQIDFLCSEIKKIISSFHYNDEASLKLSTYMMSVLVKLCSYGRVSKSHNILLEFILFLNGYEYIMISYCFFSVLYVCNIPNFKLSRSLLTPLV